jgi:RimJ/RimL family protein N-acetyltransferase
MTTSEQPTLETERLILRPFVLSDAGRVQELAGDEDIAATTLRIPHPYEDGMAEEWIGTLAGLWQEDQAATFAITLREDGALAGAIRLDLERDHERAELGYWIGKPFWNRGYATEAVREILRFAFEDLELHRVQATFLPANPASGKVLIKAGLTREGRLRHYVKKWGKFEDLELYSLLAGEYRARRDR